MYQRYCETRGWTFDVIEEQQSEIGGIKEVVVHIKGEGVFARMKYESGVHRVQRVPETESGGRVRCLCCNGCGSARGRGCGHSH